MRWEDFRRSTNVEDRRAAGGRGGGGMRLGGGMGLGGMLVMLLLAWVMGVNPLTLLSGMDGGGFGPGTDIAASQGPGQDQASQFAAAVLAQTEDVWSEEFPRQLGQSYRPPRLVLFSGGTRSGCGSASSQVGPFYCPADQRVYIDLEFLAQMQAQLGAEGDFAAAYVIAHEVGHHIQNLLGVLDQAQAQQDRAAARDANRVQVAVELMADCLAGVWAAHAEQRWRVLEPGDLEEAINAAEAVGDDTLQRRGGGEVVPDSFTHGTSAQRQAAFRQGLQSGQISACRR